MALQILANHSFDIDYAQRGFERQLEPPSQEQVRSWYPRLFRTAMRMTGNLDDAADLTQEAFCKAVLHWNQFDDKCQPVTWIHGILVNCVRDWLRGKRLERIEDNYSQWSIVDPQTIGQKADRIIHGEELSHLSQAIDELQPDLRVAFVAAVIDGYTYQEIAEMLSVPVGTVGHRVYQARKAVRESMLARFPEDRS